MKKIFTILLVILLFALACQKKTPKEKIWSPETANQWYAHQDWLRGCDFIPSTAINQLEMWQAETYDPQTIDKELGWAQSLGFNSVRVYLHYLVWEQSPEAFKQRLDDYLKIADSHNILTMFVLFDDCWNGDPKPGKQPAPKPGLHNSGWVQCPGQKQVTDSTLFPVYEKYVKDILSHFSDDSRIILWDLYNEPGNSGHLNETLPLLKKVFAWAQEIRPPQPVSAGVWNWSEDFKELNQFQLANSDIITFHNYDNAANLQACINSHRKYGKPLICTEYMRRPVSTFTACLPILKKENVGAYNWGLVSGKTQTIYPWETWEKPYESEPDVWFHDIFHPDGTPYDAAEVALIRELCLEEK